MSAEDDTYSTIFAALKHPIRRNILRRLSATPLSYTELLTSLDIENGLLNYHLESMRELVKKTEDGEYTLSEYGRAGLGLIQKIEEPVHVEPPRTLGPNPKQIKTLVAVLLIICGLTTGALAWSVSTNLNLANRMTQVSQDILYDDVWMKTTGLMRVIEGFSSTGEMNYTEVALAVTYSRELYNDFNNLRRNDPGHSSEWMKLYTSTRGVFTLFNSMQNRFWVQPYELSQEQRDVLSGIRGDLETIVRITDFTSSTSDTSLNIDAEAMRFSLEAADHLRSSLDEAFTLFDVGSYGAYMETK